MKKMFTALLLAGLVWSLTACGPKARILSSWVEPSLAGYKADNILVMGVARDETHLKLYENVFVDQLSKNKVQALASYKVIGHVLEPDRELVEAAIKKTGASSVLFTHVVDSKAETRYYPGSYDYVPGGGYYGSMYGYYGHTYRTVYTPPTSVTRTRVRLESNLYDAATAKLVWTARSETIDAKLLKTDFERVANLLITNMKNKGVL